jgi:anthranilate synthase component 1
MVDRRAPAGRRHAGGRNQAAVGLPIMKMTSFVEFKELARRGTFVPVCKEIVADLLTPVSAFLKIAEHADYAFLLESVEGGEHVGRYSFLGKDPFLILSSRQGRTIIETGGSTKAIGRSSKRCGV